MDKQKIMFISGLALALIGGGMMFHGNIFGENNLVRDGF